jgi:hypothetical protein
VSSQISNAIGAARNQRRWGQAKVIFENAKHSGRSVD